MNARTVERHEAGYGSDDLHHRIRGVLLLSLQIEELPACRALLARILPMPRDSNVGTLMRPVGAHDRAGLRDRSEGRVAWI